MVSPQLCSIFSFHLRNIPRRVLTRESMSLTTFPYTRSRLIRARVYPTCQLQYTRRTPLLWGWRSWPVCKFIRRYRAEGESLCCTGKGGAKRRRPKGNSRWWPVDTAEKLRGRRVSRTSMPGNSQETRLQIMYSVRNKKVLILNVSYWVKRYTMDRNKLIKRLQRRF